MEFPLQLGPRVTVDRITSLFGNAGPYYGEIWERQFDGGGDDLRALAATRWPDLFNQSFWVYLHDLTYVDLLPELFNYLFPACLIIAQRRLLEGEFGFTQGDADFMRALVTRNWTNVCSPSQIIRTERLLIDGFMDRLDKQGELLSSARTKYSKEHSSRFNWVGRLNSYGIILPSIEPLWSEWWNFGSAGKAIAALEYIWALIAPGYHGLNRFAYFAKREPHLPYPLSGQSLFDNDGGISSQGWTADSLSFLSRTLNFSYIEQKTAVAVEILNTECGKRLGYQILERVVSRREVVEARVATLIQALDDPRDIHRSYGWTEI